jgi:hypothetical protein
MFPLWDQLFCWKVILLIDEEDYFDIHEQMYGPFILSLFLVLVYLCTSIKCSFASFLKLFGNGYSGKPIVVEILRESMCSKRSDL